MQCWMDVYIGECNAYNNNHHHPYPHHMTLLMIIVQFGEWSKWAQMELFYFRLTSPFQVWSVCRL